jgi:hypothetical protein
VKYEWEISPLEHSPFGPGNPPIMYGLRLGGVTFYAREYIQDLTPVMTEENRQMALATLRDMRPWWQKLLGIDPYRE